ncbi:hypothetical protein ISN45_Aa02g002540 [Arabidopsis thaliana x Arabidopsis arenosa]|uniref:Uncharacterized protein n=1 Tax=Arabidopsis thaliana x Arabidopsis arenosa TaxID=1240361 RepID=A0A8T2BFW8_9BRAS|nr:hypothetical protein ISN45_Aa02g002540 [Arabidopsis thaliana x Arabidopsis arenosa]
MIVRVYSSSWKIRHLYQPLEEDELQQSLTIDIMLSSELPVVCEFEWEFHKLEVKEAARMKAIEVFFAASQLCDASALPGSIFYWFWLRSFPEESIKALAANNEGTYIVGGGSFGDIYHKMHYRKVESFGCFNKWTRKDRKRRREVSGLSLQRLKKTRTIRETIFVASRVNRNKKKQCTPFKRFAVDESDGE